MKTLIYILIYSLLILALSGCGEAGRCKHEWKLEVVYLDGSVDTTSFNKELSCKFNPGVKLKVAEHSTFSVTEITPCVVVGYGFYENAIVCGVRKYEIIHYKKTKIN